MGDYHFFYGTLCHLPLLARVAGRQLDAVAAELPDYAARIACDGRGALSYPLIVPASGERVPGLLVELDPETAARVDFYEMGFTPKTLTVRHGGGETAARTYVPGAGLTPGEPWDFARWRAQWGDVVTEAAAEFMALRGHSPAQAASARYPRILARAASRLRARVPGPHSLRRDCAEGDVQVEAMETGYAKFFAVEDYTLRHRRFSGGMMGPIIRAAFVSSDAAVVLPYDPVRDRVLLIEQFRAGPMARGDANPWLLETVAGLVDGGETPEETALREAGEEAGVAISRLVPGPSCYASPGAKTEYLYTYIGIADLHDGAARPGGLEAEGEDIRPHLVSFERMMELLDTGEIDNAPLVILALWLARHRAALRAGA
ncbi:NUDIX domain-containing protein [Paenirhodobacter sp.]|uniref:NUDIX domain-containing protein n=1 Tax=Paenirhodobacter sp. TaxID=1965326 RepID=UPI003B3C75DE